MDLLDITQWAGTEAALVSYIAAVRRMQEDSPYAAACMAAHQKQAYAEDGSLRASTPRLLQMSGDVAVIRIAGPLNNSDSWWNEYMGATGYPEIRAAVIHAAGDPAVKAIVLDIASGGGAVSGCADCGELISAVDSKIKPVTSFSDSAIMSAAYWLGVSARKVTISKTAEAGSIGVLMIHQEMTRAMDKAGVTPTVIRSGKYKALGNPYEALSATAKEELQASVDHSAEIFTQHVADRRGVTLAVADSKMGQGRIFPGEKALEAGLVDAIGNFDSVVSKAQATKTKEKIGGGIAFANAASQYVANSEGHPLKPALTEQQIAALAEGGAAGPAVELTPEQVLEAAAAQAVVDAAAAEAVSLAAATQAALAAAAALPGTDAIVVFLQGQLATANASIVDLTVASRDLKASNDAMAVTHGAMRAVTVGSVDRMRVALGHPAGAADGMSDTELLAAQDTLREQFQAKFKAGGVAAVSVVAAADSKGPGAVAEAQRQARLQAVRRK